MRLHPVHHLARLVAAALLCSLVSASPVYAAPVDAYSESDPQTTCASTTKPGTAYLLRWLVRHYRHTGYSSTLRACSSGGTSEHKDGRALDWSVDADNPTQRAQAERFLDRIFATDAAGNRHALARRMGIMYLIWNDHIWSSYRSLSYGRFEKRDYLSPSCSSVKKCSKTLRHRDHVHISLSRSGAAAQTTFYRSRNVASEPVLKPGTMQLDPEDTAVVKVTVPATGRTVNAGFKLTKGTTYRIVGDGLYRAGYGSRVADAACRWSVNGWTASNTGLLVNGRNPWSSACDGRHTHVAEYTATTTDYLRLRAGDKDASNSQGAVSFYILREDLSSRSVASHPVVSGHEPRPASTAGPAARRLRDETLTVRAAAHRGSLTDRALRKSHRYRVVVLGHAKSGASVFDGNCVKYAGAFRPQHTLDLTKPAADHLSLFISGVRINLHVAGSEASCDAREHRYVGTYRAVVSGKARVRVWDPYSYTDNSGALSVTLKLR